MLPRPAIPADQPAVEAVVRAAYTPYVARIGSPPGPMLDDYGALIEAGRVHVLEHGGAIRGVLVLLPQPAAMLLDNVAIAPAAQGLGLGRTLLRFAETAATTAGFRSIRLYTNQAMTENVALYTRLGYHETHRATENGLHRVYMEKPLP